TDAGCNARHRCDAQACTLFVSQAQLAKDSGGSYPCRRRGHARFEHAGELTAIDCRVSGSVTSGAMHKFVKPCRRRPSPPRKLVFDLIGRFTLGNRNSLTNLSNKRGSALESSASQSKSSGPKFELLSTMQLQAKERRILATYRATVSRLEALDAADPWFSMYT